MCGGTGGDADLCWWFWAVVESGSWLVRDGGISKWRLILAAVTLANPLNVCGAMCSSLCAPHKVELCWWFWAGAAVVGWLVRDGGIVEFLNGETESTSPACQLANPRATIYTDDKLSPMLGALL